MRYLSQIFTGAGLIGLLAIPVMMQARAKAEIQSNVTAFESSDYSTALNQQSSLLQPSAIADLSQATASNSADAQATQMIEQRNKATVQQSFDQWRNGTGSAFDLLAPDVTWTITGTGATAGTYRSRQALLDQVVSPTSARLSTPIVPTVRGIWADGDMVIVLWDGEATARDGRSYRNTYTWYFRMKDDQVIEAIAFLDMSKFTELWTRVSPS
ncbi:Ketosteroid isomerase-related protein-like protein (plasmid) [Trichormus variabilis ATCC 29413]|uniref:Ketosteroid isomerase-related protein-like protein n=2 Tax=Anabaena variabilis TaxID=264691 RepID=Q3M1E2_TRIV2|nr:MULTISPECIES: nuclear transport factor 2 family protein [Nostocaceae]ABA25201.1 Ketosteroid isomerase-related protein-like protein [Trichormus variabilis ATCC 29413]